MPFWSEQDIVKHATHTIIETLEPHDMLGVVVGLPDEVLLICFPTFPSQMRGCIVHVHRPDVLENAIGKSDMMSHCASSIHRALKAVARGPFSRVPFLAFVNKAFLCH